MYLFFIYAPPPRPHPRSYFQIASIAEGPDGLLWLATTSGLHHFDGHRYSPIKGSATCKRVALPRYT